MSSAGSSTTTSLDVASVYRDHFDYVVTNLRRLGVPPAALEDACHDVFLVVHRRARASISARDAMRPWLYGVARRVAADVRRSGLRHRRRVHALQTVERHDPALDQVVADRKLVDELLAALDVDQRDVFILIELEEMTAREAGAVLGINPNTAAARLRAARRSFARQLGEDATPAERARILGAARGHETTDESTRARVWAGLAPLVGPTKLMTLLGSMAASALFVATTATVVSVDTSATAAPRAATRSPATSSREPTPIEPAIVPAVLAPVSPDAPASAADVAMPDVVRPRRIPESSATTSPATTDALRAETELAGRVLRATDPATILRLVDDYRTRYPAGFFADRLSARRIEALCSSDRRDLAVTERARLGERQPALARRAFTRCEDHENEASRPTDG